jgi:hypothetical protein
MSYTYLQAQGGEYLVENFSDIPPFALLKLTLIAEEFCCSDSEMVSCQYSQYGMTFQHLTQSPGVDGLTLCAEDSHAKTLVPQEGAMGLTGASPSFGMKWLGLLAKWSQDLCLWKTPQCSLLEGLDEFSGTWPRWGLMQNGECSELSMQGLRISESASGFWPTPTCHNAKEQDSPAESKRKTPTLCHVARGGDQTLPRHLNPEWVEWLMGWPLGWTDLKPLETDKFQQWQQKHGNF